MGGHRDEMVRFERLKDNAKSYMWELTGSTSTP